MDARLKYYREVTGNKELETGPVQQYFQEQQVEEVPIEVFRDGKDEDHELLFERLTTNVEKEGRPFNWLTSEEEVEAERARREEEKFRMEEEKELAEVNKQTQKESEERSKREAHAKERMAKLAEEE